MQFANDEHEDVYESAAKMITLEKAKESENLCKMHIRIYLKRATTEEKNVYFSKVKKTTEINGNGNNNNENRKNEFIWR